MNKLNVQFAAIVLTGLLGTGNVLAADDSLQQLQEKLQDLKALNNELDKAHIGYSTAQIELESADLKLNNLKTTTDVERERLDALRETEAKFPDIDFADKVDVQRNKWREVNKAYLSEKEYVRVLRDKSIQDKQVYDIAVKKREVLLQSINRISNEVAETQLNQQLAKIRKSQNIQVSSVETCSLSVTKDDCMDKARIKAEREAAERGSLVVVDAVTEVKNFNLTKDEARSRVSARVSDIRIIKQTYDLTPDKTGWHVEYAISAMVTPAINEQMRAELKQQIIASLGSGAAVSSQSGMNEEILTGDSAYQNQRSRQPAAPPAYRPVAVEVKRNTEQELEQLRQSAIRQAEKQEAQEADKEMDSRRMPIMVF
jgi:hypothetical protein